MNRVVCAVRMAGWNALVMLGAFVLGWAGPSCSAAPPRHAANSSERRLHRRHARPETAASIVEKANSVRLGWSARAPIFPDYWLESPISARATALSQAERVRSLSAVRRALARYPVLLLRRNLRAVYCIRTLDFYGVKSSGDFSIYALYLANEGVGQGYSDSYLETSFHTQFANLLLYKHPENWNQLAWTMSNPFLFSYGGMYGLGQSQTSESDPTALDPSLWGQGFLSSYAQSAPDADFSTVAAYMMMHPAAERLAMRQSRRLRHKAEVVRVFYHRLGMEL